MGRKTKLWQRWLSLVLAIYMGLSNVPFGALAQEPEENPWEGRSAVFVGDSITAGVGTDKIYYQYLEKTLGFGSVTAMGVGGSCISAASDYGQSTKPLISRYQDIPSADLIMIFMGTNDYGHETPLGTLEDTQDGTFYGALNTIVSYLVAKHTSSKLVFVTPLHRYGFGTSKILGTKFTYDHIPNGVGATLEDYVNAVKTVCAKNGVSVVDLYTECTLDPTDAAVREQYMPDGLHPNAAGHEVVAGILETHIRSFEPVEKEPLELPEMVQGNKFAAGNNQPCRASSRVNYYLKAGTVITLKNPAVMQWACAKTSDENSSNNLGYFPEKQWTDIETAVVAEDGWVGFTFKYRDETQSFDLTKPLSDFITITEPFSGKKVSILSHSMSTYAGVSNNTSYNSTIGSNDVYYTEGRHGVYREDTWWQQAIDALGMELLVNNSWSGSCIFQPRKGEASVGYGDRAVNLHNDHTGEEPDIIWVYLGGNDFAYYQDTFGKAADVDYAALIRENTDGTFTYAAPTTACEAYAIMLHKVHNRYPDADIYCMTSTARRDPDYTGDSYPDAGQPTAFMAELHKVADKFGFPVVDLEAVIPKEAAEFDKYIADKRAHCNALGMDKITNALLSVMLGKESEIRHVTSGNGTVAEQAVLLGGSYGARVTVPEGHTLSVTMDGEDITEEAFSNGSIYIANVTGDIAVALKRGAESFRWEMQNDALVSTGETENALTLLSGTVTDGVLEDARFSLTTPVELYHDRPWVVEWKYTEDWRGVVLSSEPAKLAPGRCYLTRTKGGQLCFGSWDGTQYHNYGVDLSGLDAKAHTYRLENRIADDGSNMVYLYLDGAEIGPMNHYFIGSKDQNSTDDWLSGKDFVLPYIGSDSTPLDNCAFQFLAVWEDGHSHDYKEVVTAPTCTEKGYTTYTCECGDSYVDDYTDSFNIEILPITYEQMEQGGYYYGQDSQSTTRLRVKDQIRVEAGTVVRYSPNGLRVFLAVVSGPEADRYLEGGNWYTASGEFQVTEDGYLSILVSKQDPRETIRLAEYTADVEIQKIVHDYESVVTPPTHTQKGYTTHTCRECGYCYIDSYVDTKPFNILLIGNSFSQDATRQFRAVAKAMLGEDARVNVHLAINAAKTVAWHASQAYFDEASYKYRYTTEETNGQWVSEDEPLSKLSDLIQTEEWDVVTLQSFYPEANTGNAAGLEGEHVDYLTMDASIPAMLDYIDRYAPEAKIYYYMVWQKTEDTQNLDAGREGFEQILAQTKVLTQYAGTNSGRRFDGVIPVGAAIQNARSTYLGLINYDSDGERIIGLQRDSVHLAYTFGGYIAALTFAEYLFPEDIRQAGYTLPEVQRSPVLGALPGEYTQIAQKAVAAALANPDSVTALAGYETDPADVVAEKIREMTFDFTGVTDAEQLKESIRRQIQSVLQDHNFSEPVIRVEECSFAEDGTLHTYLVYLELPFGYTTGYVKVEKHDYVPKVTAPTCTEKGYTTHTCTVCGDSYVDSETEATGHSYGYAVETAPTLTAAGKLKGICEVCSGTTTVELPKLDEVAYDYAVTAEPTYTETGLATYTWKDTTYGNLSFEVVLETLPILYGDVNGDGTVNNKDRLVLTRYLAKWTDYPEEIINMAAADVNGDGKVNNLDRLILTRHLAKWTGYEELPYKQ